MSLRGFVRDVQIYVRAILGAQDFHEFVGLLNLGCSESVDMYSYSNCYRDRDVYSFKLRQIAS